MKRTVAIMMLFTLVLTGCTEMTTHEVENFELIRTVGIDLSDDKVILTADTGVGLKDQPGKLYKAEGADVAQAVDNLRRSFTKGEAFFAYTEHILIGKDAYSLLTQVLDYVARSIDIRMGSNIYMVQGLSAGDIMAACQSEETTVSDMLTSVIREAPRVSRGYVYNCGEVMSSLAVYGCGLILTVGAIEPTQQGDAAPKSELVPQGYAIIKDGQVAGTLTAAGTVGAMILQNIQRQEVMHLSGASVQITDSKCRVNIADNGENITVMVDITASVVESDKILTDNDALVEFEKQINKRTEQYVVDCIEMCQLYNADAAGIARKLELRHPVKFQHLNWNETFPQRTFDITVNTNIQRTYDITDPITTTGGTNAG